MNLQGDSIEIYTNKPSVSWHYSKGIHQFVTALISALISEVNNPMPVSINYMLSSQLLNEYDIDMSCLFVMVSHTQGWFAC